jgi:hypothetical protein
VYFAGGRHRDYLIYHRAGRRHRKSGWWARSLVSAAHHDDLDLRRRQDALALEQELLALDLDVLVAGMPPRGKAR